ncbi:MAG: carbamoyl-phosphate synthase large subunit [Bdellovibrionales bacterium]|nr:carbamoyl-phosphate synthase large subunit [Bdellovibrionales bacterium]
MKRHDFKTVLVLGSGPIVIGQACEFDYSGTQACRALREEGLRVVLLNSNPATIMTDPSVADRTYIEPLNPMTVIEIIRMEGVDAILPTMGGQTALNLILALSQIEGALKDVKIIGANLKAIHLAEDRRAFREVATKLGLDTPRSAVIRSVEEAQEFAAECGYPFILRPSFTLGGTGQSLVYSSSELVEKTQVALFESPIGEALVEESVLGWKEYELEVMRDRKDNAIIVCSIENLDAMGVHTGDSVTVAPAQTLTDREYQSMRMDALKLVRAVGVETGGCNVQFAVDPETGRRIVIEMNPRVSRSSALASKATGFPIAHVATKLALGYSLPEIQNNVTGTTKACFEPPIDYVALKIPRWHFEKFPGAKDELLPQMQSVGEVLAFGSSIGEAYLKALNSLERGWPRFQPVDSKNPVQAWEAESAELLQKAHSRRPYAIWDALASEVAPETVAAWTGWDPWFTRQLRQYQIKNKLGARATSLPKLPPRFEIIDTCSAENRARTPFYYSSREVLGTLQGGDLDAASFSAVPAPVTTTKGRVVILGSGPNRIGQGVEFDYCCVHASYALQKLGFETIMVNCNPETVSTDPTTSTRLYLEPLLNDSVREILRRELDPLKNTDKAAYVLVQMGGQTPLKLAEQIEAWGYKILGTPRVAIDLSEDRAQFAKILQSLDIAYPEYAETSTLPETIAAATKLGFPLLVRPSFVLGGRAMRICENEKELLAAFDEAKEVSEEHPLYLDRYLSGAVEFDIDGICDGKEAWIAGVMEHVEEAGIHSGDSSCVIPPFRLPPLVIEEMAKIARRIGVASGARGHFNVQMAVTVGDKISVIEANPRASRTVPFLAKATGYPLVEWAMRACLGESLRDIVGKAFGASNARLPGAGYAVKSPVFPFSKFKNVDPILGPEMRSTGEVMGMDESVGGAFAKAFIAAGLQLPVAGAVLFSVKDSDKARALEIARRFEIMGFGIFGTPGTAEHFQRQGLKCESIAKIGQSPLGEDLLSYLANSKAHLVVNTTGQPGSIRDGVSIRQAALRYRIPLMSTLSGADMASRAIETLIEKGIRPVALQDFGHV